MICDLHVHLAGTTASHAGNYVAPAFASSWPFRLFCSRFGVCWRGPDDPAFDEQLKARVWQWLNESQVDQVVLLGMDGAYHPDGTSDREKTLLVVQNDFVAEVAAQHEKALFGASIHPYRRDALAELERVIQRGACLVKWLPGAQNIEADHARCFPFYEALAHYGIPLLCHTGSENTLKAFPNHLNDPYRLVPAMERGVTVIAAHCGTRLFLHQRSYVDAWRELALKYEHFYGDLAAFGIITRAWSLRSFLKNPALVKKLVYGSDFPVWNMPLSLLAQISLKQALQLRRIENPFDQATQTLQALGVPAEVFSRGAQLIRVPDRKLQQGAVAP